MQIQNPGLFSINYPNFVAPLCAKTWWAWSAHYR